MSDSRISFCRAQEGGRAAIIDNLHWMKTHRFCQAHLGVKLFLSYRSEPSILRDQRRSSLSFKILINTVKGGGRLVSSDAQFPVITHNDRQRTLFYYLACNAAFKTLIQCEWIPQLGRTVCMSIDFMMIITVSWHELISLWAAAIQNNKSLFD